jgi:hypothetical protein
MAYSNAQILSAVLAKWGQPLAEAVVGGKLMRLPFLANIEAKIKSTGWVSPMWSLGKEISPLLGNVSSKMLEPIIANYIKGVPDVMLPQLAHSIVDNAITAGGLKLFEDNIEIELEDLKELKRLLRYNLPITLVDEYEVRTEPMPQGDDVAQE